MRRWTCASESELSVACFVMGQHMTWLYKDRNEAAFLDEIKGLPDRAVGLLVPIVIDERLTAAIKARWVDVQTKGGTLFSELFRDGGELGNFATRVRIGAVIGLYGGETYKDLVAINKIRNAFAHRLEVRDFNCQPVSDLARNLLLPASFPAAIGESFTTVIYGPDGPWRMFVRATSSIDMESNRGIFLRTAEILNIFLFREANEANPNPLQPRF